MQADQAVHHLPRPTAGRDHSTAGRGHEARVEGGIGGKASILMPGKHELIRRQL